MLSEAPLALICGGFALTCVSFAGGHGLSFHVATNERSIFYLVLMWVS